MKTNIRKESIFLLLAVILFANAFSQEKLRIMPIESEGKPYTNIVLNDNSSKFHFVVTPDHTGAHRSGILQKGIDRINLMQPEFVVSIGDLIEGYTSDRKDIEKQWSEFNKTISQLKMPFFYVAGNHDYTSLEMSEIWKEKYSVEYYYFTYKNVLFLCLNSEDGVTALKNPDFSDKQVDFVEKTLADHPNVSWTMVFMHQPLWLTPTAKNWFKVEKLLSARKHTVFTGHTHQYALYNRNNKNDYFVLSTMGGVNSLRGKEYGEFDHFMWVTMTDEGPSYANILLDGVEDKNVQTAERLEREELLNTSTPVQFEPYFYVGKPDKTILWKVKFNNPTKDELEYQVNLKAEKGIKLSQTSISKKLAVGASAEMTLTAESTEKGNWQPFVADVIVRAQNQSDWKTKVHVQPNEKLFIDEITKPIVIDGNLDEWGKLRFSKKDSVSNTGFNYDIRSDNQFLYIAMDVTDADIQAGSTHTNLNQDGAFVVFDARPLSTSAFNLRNPDKMAVEWLFMIASPTANEFELGFKNQMPKGITAKGRKTVKGYAVEYTIHQALLKHFQGEDWKTIRLNIAVADKNTGDLGEPNRISWQPDWMENNPGTGMFFRK